MIPSLRIALIVDPLSALVGGGRHACELSRELARRGHEVRAFGMPPTLLEGAEEVAQSSRVELGASVTSFAPDALLAYDVLSPAAWLASRIARRRHVPVALVEAGAWGERRYLQRALWRIGEALWGAYVRRTASAVVALDPPAREATLRRGFSPDVVCVVPHGVDLEQFRAGLPCEELARHRIRGRILSCHAGEAASAQLELVVHAFARTVGQRDDWSLVIACSGASPSAPRIAAQRLGVGARVHFVELAESELPSLLSSSTLFAAPFEGDGEMLLDVARALACGVPVLATDGPRARSLVGHDEHGLLIAPGDLAGWTEALRRGASSPESRTRWGRAARRLAEERLGWPTVAASFEALLSAPRASRSDALRARPDAAAHAARG